MLNSGSTHTAAYFISRLLFPIPQSPRTATEGVLPVAKPCSRVWRKASIWGRRPMNSSGCTGKFGSGITVSLRRMEQKLQMKIFLLFHLFLSLVGGLHGRRREYTPPTVQRWKDLLGGFYCLWVGVRGS